MYVRMSIPDTACRRVTGLDFPLPGLVPFTPLVPCSNGDRKRDLLRENVFLFRRVKLNLFIYFLKIMTRFRSVPRNHSTVTNLRCRVAPAICSPQNIFHCLLLLALRHEAVHLHPSNNKDPEPIVEHHQ